MDACDVQPDCRPEILRALVSGLERFGTLSADPDWLVSMVWLQVADGNLIASSSTMVLADGYVARLLAIHRIEDFAEQLESKLPDISNGLTARRSDLDLPDSAAPEPPADLRRPPEGPYSLSIVIRVAAHRTVMHRVACGLLFEFSAGGTLLVGTDVATLAMVMSEDEALVDRYMVDCERVSADEYLKFFDC